MDSLAPNKVASEWISKNKIYFPKLTLLKPEYTLGDSRFDFYAEYDDDEGLRHKTLIEVKGCTLEKDGVVLFPDALKEANAAGVKIIAVECDVTPDTLLAKDEIEVRV